VSNVNCTPPNNQVRLGVIGEEPPCAQVSFTTDHQVRSGRTLGVGGAHILAQTNERCSSPSSAS